MTTRHKHYDAIVAFAEGKTIQFGLPRNGGWQDWGHPYCPGFYEGQEYRVKPAPVKYRNCLMQYKDTLWVAAIKPENYLEFERSRSFVKWLGSEQEVEI